MANFAVRSLTELDIDGIVRLDERSQGSYRPDLWEERVTTYLRRDPEGSVIAEADGRVVGFLLSDVRAGEFGIEEPTGWIEVVGVDPESGGRGIGRAMAEEVFSRFRSRGVRRVRTMVDASMPELEAYFGRLGFVPDSLRPFVKNL